MSYFELSSFDQRKRPRSRHDGSARTEKSANIGHAAAVLTSENDTEALTNFSRTPKTKRKPKALPKAKAVVKRHCKRRVSGRTGARNKPIQSDVPARTGKGDIMFPPTSNLKIVGDTSPWQWAEKFKNRLETAGFERKPLSKVQIFTEFSGSSCPEAAAESVSAALSMSVDFVSAGDISQQCRKLIMEARHYLS